MKTSKRLSRLLLAAALLALVFLGLLAARRSYFGSEPSWKGRSFSSWFGDMDWPWRSDAGAADRFNASLNAIRAMGTNACEPLLALIENTSKDPAGVRYWKFYNDTSPRWRKFLPAAQYPGWRRLIALQILAQLDEPTRTAMTPRLIDIMERYHAQDCGWPPGAKIDWSGEFFNPPVKDYLAASPNDWPSQSQILGAIKLSGSYDPRLYPMLLTQAQEAALTQGKMGGFSYYDPAPCLANAAIVSTPILLAAATNREHYVRFTAIAALARIEDRSEGARTAIMAAVSDPDATVQREAIAAAQKLKLDPAAIAEMVGRIGNFAPPATVSTNFSPLPALPMNWGHEVTVHFDELMGGTNPAVRAGALHAMKYYRFGILRLGRQLAALTNAAAEPDENIRREAAELLALRPTNLPPKLEAALGGRK